MDLDETARRLYALAPEEFTAARDADAKQAKAAGDASLAAQVKALRKPSVGAWLLNLLATQEADLLEQLLSLGPALAEAQVQGQGDGLRQLGAQRRELVGAVTTRAVALGGRPASAAVRDEVSGTLEAALSDPSCADAVRSGRLVRALSYAGFGGVDLYGAVAVAAPAKAKTPKREIANAEAAALEAVVRAKMALRDAEVLANQADEQHQRVERKSEVAVQAVRDAQRSQEQARMALDRLRRG